MPVFRYKVRDKFGKQSTGLMGGDSRDAIASHFEAMGYTPITIEVEEDVKESALLGKRKKIKREDMNIFNRQLVTMIKAGLPLLASLNSLEKQTSSPTLRNIIKDIIKDIEGGSSFSQALKKHPTVFNDLYVNTIKGGEMGGALDIVLERLADLSEHEADNIQKIKSATRYPIITISVLVIGFSVLVTFVVPKFTSIFDQFEGQLPLPTRILIGINYLITNYWYAIIGVGAISFFAGKKYINTKQGRRVWDRIKLKMPVFGTLIFMLTMSRFTRITAIMIRSGVPILAILDMVSGTTGNVLISEAIRDVLKSVNEGKSMAEPMAKSKVFSPMVVQMVAIGEETGQLDDLLFRVSEYYDSQADYIIKNLTTMIEPILIVTLGCVVLLLALAIFLPMWNMISLIKK
ncbi:MAG: type II secretion system F family protein [Candidatus Omnitrophica bacterium]|nr:type II secretion system F family protein [Candidatus Omnitrophota bacterium]